MTLSPEEKRFVDALIGYFPQGTLLEWRSDGESLLADLEYFSDAPQVEIPDSALADLVPFDIQGLILNLVRTHGEKWSVVCEANAPVKIAAATRK